jgi:hypothetical protein
MLPSVEQQILPTPQQALSRAVQQMRYLQDPANSPEIQRRNRRRMRLCLPPLEEYYPMVYRQALRAVETNQGNGCLSQINSQT